MKISYNARKIRNYCVSIFYDLISQPSNLLRYKKMIILEESLYFTALYNELEKIDRVAFKNNI